MKTLFFLLAIAIVYAQSTASSGCDYDMVDMFPKESFQAFYDATKSINDSVVTIVGSAQLTYDATGKWSTDVHLTTNGEARSEHLITSNNTCVVTVAHELSYTCDTVRGGLELFEIGLVSVGPVTVSSKNDTHTTYTASTAKQTQTWIVKGKNVVEYTSVNASDTGTTTTIHVTYFSVTPTAVSPFIFELPVYCNTESSQSASQAESSKEESSHQETSSTVESSKENSSHQETSSTVESSKEESSHQETSSTVESSKEESSHHETSSTAESSKEESSHHETSSTAESSKEESSQGNTENCVYQGVFYGTLEGRESIVIPSGQVWFNNCTKDIVAEYHESVDGAARQIVKIRVGSALYTIDTISRTCTKSDFKLSDFFLGLDELNNATVTFDTDKYALSETKDGVSYEQTYSAQGVLLGATQITETATSKISYIYFTPIAGIPVAITAPPAYANCP